MSTHFNAASWLVERHLDEGRGATTAIVSDAGARTYDQLAGDVWAAGNGLAAAGVRPGERVVLVMNDEPALPALLLGTMRIGAVAIPVSTMLTAGELAEITADAAAAALVVSDAYTGHVATITAGAPSVRVVVTAGPPGSVDVGLRPIPVIAWSDLHERRPPPDPGTDGDAPALWLYTSGTTGRPKGAIHRHASLRATAETYARAVLGAGPDDRFYSVAKLFFAFGLGNALTFPFAVGATAILDPGRPTPARVAELAERYQPTLFFAPPGFCAALVDSGVDAAVLTSVRYAVTAGETLPADLWRRFRDRFGVEILDGIGTTEALHIFCSNHPGDIRPGSTGRPVAGYECKLLDERGAEVTEANVAGFLHVRGDSIATGYWRRPEATAIAFVDGWLRTGDVYSRDSDGYYAYFGRTNDLIKPGGIWVSPAEVEAVLTENDDVLEVAVVGGRDADGLEVAVAFVVARAGRRVDPDALLARCRGRMAGFKRPRHVIVVDELPKTATGKVRRFALRDLLAGDALTPEMLSRRSDPGSGSA
ncbi:MAG: benzoate-CoA ligase family protein [Actinomycetota bacterium]|nr:benzoate-CoA ligase family protein [Actinomycetota bacterium]